MPGFPGISAVVPVYNESALIERTVPEIDDFLARHFRRHELIVVESGSTDGSAAICDRLAAVRPNLRVIHEAARNGFGAAVRLGIGLATQDLVCVISADLTYPLASLLDAAPLMERYDCVLSYRSRDPRVWGRRVQSAFYNLLARSILGLRARNVNSALKLFRREIIQGLPLKSSGWFIDTEIVCRIERAGISCVEIPVPFTDRLAGVSSVPWTAPMEMIAEMLRFRRTMRAEAAATGRSAAR